MVDKKIKCYAVTLLGTGLNSSFVCLGHRVQAYQASTYHVFTHANGVEVWKNDFGVGTIRIEEISLSPEQIPDPPKI